jgi:hypothetical protein
MLQTVNRLQNDGMEGMRPNMETLLAFLAEWQAVQGTTLGRIITAAQLADVQELERIFALLDERSEAS